MKFNKSGIILVILFLSVNLFAQTSADFLGIKLRPEVQQIFKEIEQKSVKKIYGEFIRQQEFMFGSSFISADGVPVIWIDYSLQKDEKKLEAVVAHELLHLRLRVNNYPNFLFSPNVNTAKGRAIDTEQSNINDLTALIEHRIFKADLEKLELYKYLDLAGDTAKNARKYKNRADGQSDAINYARAILEYQNAADIEEVRKIFEANNWRRSITTGREIADIISSSPLKVPKDEETVFLKCLLKLYSSPRSAFTFKLTPDSRSKFFRRMIISTARTEERKRK